MLVAVGQFSVNTFVPLELAIFILIMLCSFIKLESTGESDYVVISS